MGLSSRQSQTEDLANFRDNDCLEDTVFPKLASEMSCKSLGCICKSYSLLLVKAETDLAVVVSMRRQEEVFWFWFS